MSTSVIHPNTIQIRPSRLGGLVVGVAILTGVTTWSVSQVTTDSHASSPSAAVDGQAARRTLDTPTSQRPASVFPPAYVDGVVALDAEQRAAIYGNLGLSEPSVQSVNAHSPELQAIDTSPTAVTRDLVNRGLIPRQSLEPATQSMDTNLQDLVNRGLIPRQTLEPASQSDTNLQDLVNRGLIPRQTLDD